MKANNKLSFKHAKRVVVKVGSNVLTEDNGLNLRALKSISRQICRLIDDGLEIVLVTSGAMASGVKKIGLSTKIQEMSPCRTPKTLRSKILQLGR